MRIVAGQYGGRRLEVPKNRDIRPTSDKVRGSIFNALEARGLLDGANVLDCCCGTGALGFEALSRGAVFCSFWDKDKRSLELAKRNAAMLGLLGQSDFALQDVMRLNGAKNDRKYDLLFMDPPYRNDIVGVGLVEVGRNNFLKNGAVCVVETEKDFEPDFSDAFLIQSEKIYGDTKVFFVSYKKIL